MTKRETLIAGAGPAGLAFAMHWPGQTLIIEQEQEAGGLCRSFEFGGAVFDIGGHSFQTPHAEVAALVRGLMGDRWEEQRRDARVLFEGRMIDYPFQRNLDQIADPAIAGECRRGMETARHAGEQGTDFESWIAGQFGPGVARHFMLPYNRKLWARDLRTMSCDWVGERIAGGETESAGPGERRAPLAADSRVGYPAQGGFAEIFKAMAARAGPVAFGERLIAIDLAAKTARSASGATFEWDRLVSTIPLPLLLDCLPECPEDLRRAASRLEWVSLKVVMIAAPKAPGERPQRLYIADPAVPAHKIAFNHRSSAALGRRPREAVMCEVSYSRFKPPPDDETLKRVMVEWLTNEELIGGGAVEAKVLDVPFAYPVPTADARAIVNEARAFLAGHRIYSIGRFGGWNYANSDGCIHEAMALATALAV